MEACRYSPTWSSHCCKACAIISAWADMKNGAASPNNQMRMFRSSIKSLSLTPNKSSSVHRVQASGNSLRSSGVRACRLVTSPVLLLISCIFISTAPLSAHSVADLQGWLTLPALWRPWGPQHGYGLARRIEQISGDIPALSSLNECVTEAAQSSCDSCAVANRAAG